MRKTLKTFFSLKESLLEGMFKIGKLFIIKYCITHLLILRLVKTVNPYKVEFTFFKVRKNICNTLNKNIYIIYPNFKYNCVLSCFWMWPLHWSLILFQVLKNTAAKITRTYITYIYMLYYIMGYIYILNCALTL